MEDEGFNSVFFSDEIAHELGQQILVAESDGRVRQKTTWSIPADPASKKAVPNTGKDEVGDLLVGIVSEITHIEPGRLDKDADWSELGMDSLLSMQLLTVIESQFGLRIYQNELAEYKSLSKLIEYVKRERVELKENRPTATVSIPDAEIWSDSGQITAPCDLDQVEIPQKIIPESVKVFFECSCEAVSI